MNTVQWYLIKSATTCLLSWQSGIKIRPIAVCEKQCVSFVAYGPSSDIYSSVLRLLSYVSQSVNWLTLYWEYIFFIFHVNITILHLDFNNYCGIVLVRFRKIAKKDCYLPNVCLSVRMVKFCSHWTDFHQICYLGIFRKSVENIQVSIQSDTNNLPYANTYARLW